MTTSYTNGRIPDGDLVTIARGARLLPGPARSFGWICDEVERRYGWRPRPTGSFDGYRPLSGNYYAQTETFLRRYSARATGSGPYGDVRFWNKVRYVRISGAAAAVPGTSNHGWASAVDVADLLSFTSDRYEQFAEVAAEAGWTNSEGRQIGEYWHWVDVSTAQAVKNGTYTAGAVPSAPNVGSPDPITPKGFLMALSDADQLEVIRLLREIHAGTASIAPLLNATGTTTGKIDRTLQAVVDIRGGVAGLPALIAAVQGGDVDEVAVARELSKLLPGYTVTIKPEA